ncbi:Rap1a/Tai family immunity protein [Kiloniella sp.]|uniref:Rap1a/Tai family immunity protein n=1 Tax=Kiloniella sp. TaxID=1938587 RepID=UPI003B01CAB9
MTTLLISGPARADYFEKNNLYTECVENRLIGQKVDLKLSDDFCSGYIAGVTDNILSLNNICPLDQASFTYARETVAMALKKDPQHRTHIMGQMTVELLQFEFPCKE